MSSSVQLSSVGSGPTGARPAAPKPVDGKGQAGLLALLRIEASVRDVETLPELRHFMTNESWKLVRGRQTFLLEMRGHSFRVQSVSALATVDRNAPLVRLVEGVVEQLSRTHSLDRAQEFLLDRFVETEGDAAAAYPFRNFAWVPLVDRSGSPFAGLLFTRDTAWSESDLVVAKRIASTFAHAWLALARQRTRWVAGSSFWKIAGAGIAVAAVLLFVPVPMSAVAPVEVIPRTPAIVAAPIDGVVTEIVVSPNEAVKAGQVLLRFATTDLANRLQIAERAMQVAEARLKQTRQGAFSDPALRRETAIAEAELDLKQAEKDYAVDLLARSMVKAERGGIALFADRSKMIGRPFAVGEALLEIADPGEVQVRLDMAVGDALLLSPEAEVSVYLDSDPLRPYAARIEQADYRAREIEGGRLAIKARASLTVDDRDPPRLGVRGSGRVLGPSVPLGLYLFRRPITMVRQWLGL